MKINRNYFKINFNALLIFYRIASELQIKERILLKKYLKKSTTWKSSLQIQFSTIKNCKEFIFIFYYFPLNERYNEYKQKYKKKIEKFSNPLNAIH